jgi:hypothetical protein
MESSRDLCGSSCRSRSRGRSRHSLLNSHSSDRDRRSNGRVLSLGSGNSHGSRGRNGSTLVGGALAGDVARLSTLVADLTSRAERAAVGSGAVARDVTELAAGVALHGLSLAVTGEVVGAAALVAGRGAGVALEATAETALEATTAAAGSGGAGGSSGSGAGGSSGGGVGAVALGFVKVGFCYAGGRELTARWPGWLQL